MVASRSQALQNGHIMGAVEFAVFVGLIGLAIGSFLNVCVDRLPRGLSIVTIPSHCEVCGHTLGVRDLIPLVSYLWLRGRCRHCKASISIRLPLVELATGLLFLYVAARYGVTLQTPVLLTFVAALVVVFAIDMEHSLILNRITYPGIVIAFLVAPWGPVGDALSVQASYVAAGWGLLLGGGVLGAIYLLARLVAHGGFGLGDVKLGLMLGAMLGPVSTFVTLQLSFIVGGVVAIALLGLKLRSRRDLIPFGPFLASAGVLSLFWGGDIFTWYQGLFLP